MKQDRQPYVFRRHARTCRFFGPGGRETRSDKCNCPFHADGVYRGNRIRLSLGTRSWQTAERRLNAKIEELERHNCGGEEITLGVARERFLDSYHGVGAQSTIRKYGTKLRLIEEFCARGGVRTIKDVNVNLLEKYRHSRSIAPVTWKVELQALRTFFRFCQERGWTDRNPAKQVRAPRNVRPNEVVPYSFEEEARILAACDEIGGEKYRRGLATYERLRARAMVLLLRDTALRISDVCALRRDSIAWDDDARSWRIRLRTQKSGEPVFLPLPSDLKLALDALPLPRGAAADCPYFFWNGETSRRAVVGIAERTLAAVFKRSGVKKAHAHRFRHTLATRLLGQGATHEQVADILGNSPEIVRKHYAKWSKGRQDNIDRLMFAHFQTGLATSAVTLQSH